jgi:hypothetical protein
MRRRYHAVFRPSHGLDTRRTRPRSRRARSSPCNARSVPPRANTTTFSSLTASPRATRRRSRQRKSTDNGRSRAAIIDGAFAGESEFLAGGKRDRSGGGVIVPTAAQRSSAIACELRMPRRISKDRPHSSPAQPTRVRASNCLEEPQNQASSSRLQRSPAQRSPVQRSPVQRSPAQRSAAPQHRSTAAPRSRASLERLEEPHSPRWTTTTAKTMNAPQPTVNRTVRALNKLKPLMWTTAWARRAKK